jgi:hypothetical protein
MEIFDEPFTETVFIDLEGFVGFAVPTTDKWSPNSFSNIACEDDHLIISHLCGIKNPIIVIKTRLEVLGF